MKVFVSYPGNIGSIVRQIFEHLPPETVDHWIDEREILLGEPIDERLAENIEDSDYFVSFLNEEALNSEWIKQELRLAFKREEALGRCFVLPVRVGLLPEDKLPLELRGSRRFLAYQGSNRMRPIATFANELTDELFRLACERPLLVCEGMATVYFFSFVDNLFAKMRKASAVDLELPDKSRHRIKPVQIRLRVVLPDSLDDDLDEIVKRLHLQDGVLWEAEKRLFKVSRRASDNVGESESVTLYDVPNILSSAAKLYTYSRLTPHQGRRHEWERLVKLELRSFKIRLEELVSGTLSSDMRSRIEVLSASACT